MGVGDAYTAAQFLGLFALDGLESTFRSFLLAEEDPETPRSYALSALLSVMKVGGLEAHQLMLVRKYLADRTDEQLMDDLVFIQNGSLLGVPKDDGSVVLDMGSMKPVEPKDIPPRVQLVVWYVRPLLEGAQDVLN